MRQFEQDKNGLIAPLESIKIDPKSRDDVPALLRGLQHLYPEKLLREAVMA